MAHEVETMAYYGEVPWHGLGKKVEAAMTAEEAIAAAGLDWEVKMAPVYVHNLKGQVQKVEGKFAVQRVTDGKVFNILGNYYTPVQNREAFAFFDGVAGAGGARYETAGSLRGGERIWIMARVNNGIHILGEESEKVDTFVALMNCHSGYSALQMYISKVRIVCMNTLRMSLSTASNRFYARHTSGVFDRIAEAQEILGIVSEDTIKFEAQAERLATLQLPPAEMPLLLMAAFHTTGAKELKNVYAPVAREFKKVEELYETSPTLQNPKIKGTKWAAFNAISEYTDHVRDYRGKDKDDARLNGIWLGGGAAIKDRAWDYLIKTSK